MTKVTLDGVLSSISFLALIFLFFLMGAVSVYFKHFPYGLIKTLERTF